MDNFVTNTAAKSLPNQFGCQIFEVYNGSDLAGAYVGICENHTGQIDLYNGSDLAKFVQIDLAHQVAPLFVLLIALSSNLIIKIICYNMTSPHLNVFTKLKN